MRGIRAPDLEAFLQYYQNSHTLPPISFASQADGKLSFNDYQDRVATGRIARAPFVIGSNADEESTLVPYPLGEDDAGPNRTLAAAATEWLVCLGAAQPAQWRLDAGLKTFRFQYNGNFTNLSPLPWMGAFHCAELPMFTGTFSDYRGGPSHFQVSIPTALHTTISSDRTLAFVDGD